MRSVTGDDGSTIDVDESADDINLTAVSVNMPDGHGVTVYLRRAETYALAAALHRQAGGGLQIEREWLSTEDLAIELQVPIATVRKWREYGTGPVGHRLGRHVRYRRSDIDTWLKASRDPAGGR